MKNENNKLFPILKSALIFFGGALVGVALFAYLPKTKASSLVPDDVQLGKFWQIWNLMETKYPFDNEEPTSQKKVEGAIKGLVASYNDPFSHYFTPEESKSFHEEVAGSFSGIGAEVGNKDSVLTVISPLEGSPAQKAGLLAGDVILEINGTKSIDMTAEQAVKLIRGEKGTVVTLKISRNNSKAPIIVSIVRDTVSVPTIKTYKKNGVDTIELYQFNDQAYSLFKKKIEEASLTNDSKLIVDLRGNPGGYLESAIKIASLFLPAGDKIVEEKPAHDGADSLVRRSYGYMEVPIDTKVVVLVDSGSASASEILAGALRDNKRATIMGQTSYGKGSVQELVDLEDGSALKVTVAKWYTPKGFSISKSGIKPDIEIIDSNPKDQKDEQLDAAINYLNKSK